MEIPLINSSYNKKAVLISNTVAGFLNKWIILWNNVLAIKSYTQLLQKTKKKYFPHTRIQFHGWAEATGPYPAGGHAHSSQHSASQKKKTAKITAMDKNSFGVSSSPPPFKPVAFMLRQPQSALEPRHSTGSSPGKSPAGWCIQFIIKLHTICTVFHPAPIHNSQPITVVCIYNGILLSH